MLMLMVAFFGVIVAVNIFMMYKAVTTFRGEDVKQSYRQGLDYNATLKNRLQQFSRGWSADIRITANHNLVLRIADANGLAVRGLAIKGILKHPVDTDLDTVLVFRPDAKLGGYTAALPTEIKGKRWVYTTAVYANSDQGGDAIFETKNEIWLK